MYTGWRSPPSSELLAGADLAAVPGLLTHVLPHGCHRSSILGDVVTIIVPAHNEGRVVGRLLGQLISGVGPGELDIIVVANGCTDDTAQIAAGYSPMIRVVSIPVPSKREALAVGNQAATGFPRLYVDADVELGASDVRALD